MQWFCKKGLALLPADDKAVRAIRKLEEGEAVQLEMQRSRSVPHHRFFMKCCSVIGQNQDPIRTEHQIKEALKEAAGHVDTLRSPNGTVFTFPRSIAFAKLSADEWNDLWPSLDEAMRREFKFDCSLFKEGYAGFYE